MSNSWFRKSNSIVGIPPTVAVQAYLCSWEPFFLCVVGGEGSRNRTETMPMCNLGFQTAAGVSAQEFTNYHVHNLRSTTIFGGVGVLNKFILRPYYFQSLISRSHSSTKLGPSQYSAIALFCGCAVMPSAQPWNKKGPMRCRTRWEDLHQLWEDLLFP